MTRPGDTAATSRFFREMASSSGNLTVSLRGPRNGKAFTILITTERGLVSGKGSSLQKALTALIDSLERSHVAQEATA